MKDKKAYWISGTVSAGLGVALVRLLSPEIAGAWGLVAAAVGYSLVVIGITTIAFGTRRKKSEAFITVGKDAKGRERR